MPLEPELGPYSVVAVVGPKGFSEFQDFFTKAAPYSLLQRLCKLDIADVMLLQIAYVASFLDFAAQKKLLWQLMPFVVYVA